MIGFPREGTKFLDAKTGAPDRVWMRLLQRITNILGFIGYMLAGSHTTRLGLDTSALNDGTAFFEEDRGVFYALSGNAWAYATGIMTGTRANAPTGLGAADAGFLFEVTDFGHLVRWSGAAWTFAPGDDGPARFADFAVAPTAPGWQLCDGTATTYLTVGATLGTAAFNTPNLTGTPAYKKQGAAYTGVINATGNTAVDTGGGTVVAAGVGTTVAAHTHVHVTGDPANLVVLPYFRR